jgi:hypothetical protein
MRTLENGGFQSFQIDVHDTSSLKNESSDVVFKYRFTVRKKGGSLDWRGIFDFQG